MVKMKKVLFVLAVVALTYGAAQAVMVNDLTNRYSFLNSGGTEVVDQINGENGVLDGTATIAGGQLVLDGGGSAHLPGDVLDMDLTSVSFETWFTVSPESTTWARLFDFGGTGGTSWYANSGGNYIIYVPNTGNNPSDSTFTVSTMGYPGWQKGEDVVHGTAVAVDTPTYIACVWDGVLNTISYYLNGDLVGTIDTTMDLAAVERMNAFIGDSSYVGDPYFKGSVDEFRIWSVALPAEHIATSYAMGPDTVCMTIPEPATIALLSLGGLLLSRRRKS